MAANYSTHHLLRFGGQYGPETWSCGLRMAVSGKRPTETDLEVSQLLLPSRAGAVRKFWNAVRSYAVPGVALSWVSLNHIGRDGKYTSDVSVDEHFTAIQGNGSATNWCGPDVAVGVTLLTAAERGYASKGRIFLPLNSNLTLNGTLGPEFGNMSAANRDLVANAMATLCRDLNDAEYVFGGEVYPPVTWLNPRVGVFSPGTGKKQDMSSPGAWRAVTGVRVGGQLDTQRRRINQQPDLWAINSATVAVSG